MTETFLGVNKSITDKIWTGPSLEVERNASFLSQSLSLKHIVALILSKRKIAVAEADSFLNPKLRTLMPDPSELLDMDVAANRIYEAIKNNEKILIFGDYDVDGVVSSVILKEWFNEQNVNSEIYIPDRHSEGYGPNIETFTEYSERKDLIICVDCGISAFEPISIAKKK